jgi:nucleoside-diphosphate-sugar epimerase
VNISSIKIFSHLDANPITADSNPHPVTPYGIAKLTAEHFLDAYVSPHCPVTHLRLCSVASAGEHPSQLLSRLCQSAFGREPITVNAGHDVNILYIDEAVDLIVSATLRSQRRSYILAARPIGVGELAKRFEAAAGTALTASYSNLGGDTPDPVFESDIDLFAAPWVRTTNIDAAIRRIIENRLACESPTLARRLD